MDYDIIGAIKIKDGLFLGDEYAAQVHFNIIDLIMLFISRDNSVIYCIFYWKMGLKLHQKILKMN